MIWSINAFESSSDREFIEQLYQRHKRIMFHTAQKFAISQQDQEDIVQNSMEKLIEKISVLRTMDSGELPGYIVGTIRNTSIDFIRRQDVINNHNISLDEDKVETEDYLLGGSLSDASIRLKEIWPELSDDDRFLLEGKYIWGLSDRELSSKLHCKQGSVRMKLTRARRRAFELISEKEN